MFLPIFPWNPKLVDIICFYGGESGVYWSADVYRHGQSLQKSATESLESSAFLFEVQDLVRRTYRKSVDGFNFCPFFRFVFFVPLFVLELLDRDELSVMANKISPENYYQNVLIPAIQND